MIIEILLMFLVLGILGFAYHLVKLEHAWVKERHKETSQLTMDLVEKLVHLQLALNPPVEIKQVMQTLPQQVATPELKVYKDINGNEISEQDFEVFS